MEKRKNNWPILGFGCMRFPTKNGRIDLRETERELAYAIRHGVNYLDTAYVYKGSEKALGVLLAKNNWREKVVVATKLPHYLIHSVEGAQKIFSEQLSRLHTDYIDNYLMHMLPDVQVWNRLVHMGILEWLLKKKAMGQIRRIGFSYHGNSRQFMELLDAFDWDFCQVQYNYMDEYSQAGRAGVEYAAKKGIPVVIMEPLRGGRLVNGLPIKAREIFKRAKPRRSPAEWAFRWLWNQPGVSVVLSGMNSMEMLKENIRIAQSVRVGELTKKDNILFEKVRQAVNEKIKVACTGCGYCQPCPAGVDIPGVFRCYNVSYTDHYLTGMREYLMCTTMRAHPTNASLCKKCGKCEKHCPQGIPIRKELGKVVRHMEHPIYKAAAFVSKRMFR
ncbi:MAG: aldo/keto reductase [Eubacterium sp.]|nr:aldo/keto reductase [Eubacterium sp.]